MHKFRSVLALIALGYLSPPAALSQITWEQLNAARATASMLKISSLAASVAATLAETSAKSALFNYPANNGGAAAPQQAIEEISNGSEDLQTAWAKLMAGDIAYDAAETEYERASDVPEGPFQQETINRAHGFYLHAADRPSRYGRCR